MYDPVKTLLITARARLAETGWTQNCSARDRTGASCEIMDPTACTYCLHGALNWARITAGASIETVHQAIRALWLRTTISPVQWNDHPSRSRDEVLALLDAAIIERDGGADLMRIAS